MGRTESHTDVSQRGVQRLKVVGSVGVDEVGGSLEKVQHLRVYRVQDETGDEEYR